MEDMLKSEWYLELKKLHEERKKTIKKGVNVIHLQYLGNFVDNETIDEIEEKLSESELELSRYDYSGFPQASLDDYRNVIYFVIEYPIISTILFGTASNLVWDTIIFAIKKVRNKIKQKTYKKLTSSSNENIEITYGLNVKLDENTGFNFRIAGDISEEIIDKSLDKVIDLLKEQKLNETYKQDYFLTFNETTELWEKVDVEEEIRKRVASKAK